MGRVFLRLLQSPHSEQPLGAAQGELGCQHGLASTVRLRESARQRAERVLHQVSSASHAIVTVLTLALCRASTSVCRVVVTATQETVDARVNTLMSRPVS